MIPQPLNKSADLKGRAARDVSGHEMARRKL
jgi:hypothetical protein